ncbi:ABC transporter permease [Cohnella cellulosilytica]|uniref:ABC transporter permease n=1 Tax=Cohnella cellulosilytica TaxID=986710 RepID=A0ABW2F8S9_9BACL
MGNVSHEEQGAFLRSLRRERAAAFRQEVVPYSRYVIQSGFGLFASAIFFAALIWYTDLLKAVPSDWPAKPVGVAVLSLAAIRAPLRTYLRPADPIFLLAMENRVLGRYIGDALRIALVAGVLRMLAVFALYAPIYSRAPQTAGLVDTHPLVALALACALLAGFNVYGGWRERRMAARLWRIGLKAVRVLLTVAAVAALLLKPLGLAIPFAAVCLVVLALLWRLPPQHALPWDRLIEEEASNRRRWMGFLSWFVDVPSETAKPAYRRWIAWAGDFVPWSKRRAWHYLYAKTFLRGETFGALWRWVVVTCLVLAVSGSALLDAIFFAVSVVVCGLQLSELKRVRFVETADTLPIPPQGKLPAAASVSRWSGIAAVAIIGIVGPATAGLGTALGNSGAGDALRFDYWLAALAFGLLWCGWWMPRKIAKSNDEDDL